MGQCEGPTTERQEPRATGRKYVFEPYAAQMGDKPWGKTLKIPPTDPTGHYEFGFDAQGDLLIMREHSRSSGLVEQLIVRSELFINAKAALSAKQRMAHGLSEPTG